MTALAAPEGRVMVPGPGVYPDLPEEDYHADPVEGGSLSSTGARQLVASCPAKFRYAQLHPSRPSRAMNLGTAAHQLILQSGPGIVVIKADNYRTAKAQEQRDAAYAAGRTPLLPKEYEQVKEMAARLREHPEASALLDPRRGLTEQTIVWRDEATGVMQRARLDHLPYPTARRMIIADYKTCQSAAPPDIEKAIYDRGYHQQGEWYTRGVRELGLASRTVFVLICQETEPPYVVTVAEIDPPAMRIAEDRNRKALELYARCVATDTWPGYSTDIEVVSLPAWVKRRMHRENM
ncbi:PD-(D/E)XK nuclease-like domain-containing protein [Streptosporangium longisporum]|uniref:Putative exodeoxyribonuclease 8 PDDEXK-like domain-containing protein n=1 Tax=Streptosporangium longisporum TaxID=46187 RepID=A0ABP6L4L4_9ACTN